MALKDRIEEILGTSGLSKGALAEVAGVSAGAVSLWLNESPSGTKSLKAGTAEKIQAKTGFSAVWVATGKGPKMASQIPNTSPAESRSSVPLISWVKAGLWGAVEDMFQPGEADHWVSAFNSNPGPNAFALRVDGDSMTSPFPGERSFPDGTIIIVDPGRAAQAGDYVVAKDVTTQHATFKRLVYDGGRWFLKPLNPSYPTMEIDDPSIRVIGRVVEFHIGGKL